MVKLANHFANEHRIVLVTQTTPDSDTYPVNPGVIRISLNAGRPSANGWQALVNNVTRWQRLRQILRREQPNALLCFMPTANVLGLLAAIGRQIPVYVSERVHPPFAEVSSMRRRLQRLLYPRAANVVLLSKASIAWTQAHLNVQKLTVIPNGVSLPLPMNAPAINPADLLAADEHVVLFVGRLVPQKQPDIALDVFAANATENWKLVMIGQGQMAAELKEKVASLNLTERVVFIPHAGNLQAWYERADIFLSTAKFEGSPNALLEAMACGCAPLAFDCPTGPADLIRHKENGLLFPLDAVNELQQALNNLMASSAQRQQLAQAAQGVTREFSDQRFKDAWNNLLTGSDS